MHNNSEKYLRITIAGIVLISTVVVMPVCAQGTQDVNAYTLAAKIDSTDLTKRDFEKPREKVNRLLPNGQFNFGPDITDEAFLQAAELFRTNLRKNIGEKFSWSPGYGGKVISLMMGKPMFINQGRVFSIPIMPVPDTDTHHGDSVISSGEQLPDTLGLLAIGLARIDDKPTLIVRIQPNKGIFQLYPKEKQIAYVNWYQPAVEALYDIARSSGLEGLYAVPSSILRQKEGNKYERWSDQIIQRNLEIPFKHWHRVRGEVQDVFSPFNAELDTYVDYDLYKYVPSREQHLLSPSVIVFHSA